LLSHDCVEDCTLRLTKYHRHVLSEDKFLLVIAEALMEACVCLMSFLGLRNDSGRIKRQWIRKRELGMFRSYECALTAANKKIEVEIKAQCLPWMIL
jgi:hypothetical protein